MAEEQDAWEDLNAFRMDEESIMECIKAAPGCAVTWVNTAGRAMGVWITPTVLDGEVWVTTTTNRSKTKAWLKDPRTTAVFGVPGLGSVTIVGTIELTYDAELRTRFLNKLFDRNGTNAPGREAFLQHMDTEGRMVGPVAVKKNITFDPRKLVT